MTGDAHDDAGWAICIQCGDRFWVPPEDRPALDHCEDCRRQWLENIETANAWREYLAWRREGGWTTSNRCGERFWVPPLVPDEAAVSDEICRECRPKWLEEARQRLVELRRRVGA